MVCLKMVYQVYQKKQNNHWFLIIFQIKMPILGCFWHILTPKVDPKKGEDYHSHRGQRMREGYGGGTKTKATSAKKSDEQYEHLDVYIYIYIIYYILYIILYIYRSSYGIVFFLTDLWNYFFWRISTVFFKTLWF
jgi:hypothetical protein